MISQALLPSRDPSQRLRVAIQEGDLSSTQRLIPKAGLRNPDPKNRYTSLMYAALGGHVEIFEYLLELGHDDEELSRDAVNNTLLHLLAYPPSHPHHPRTTTGPPSSTSLTSLPLPPSTPAPSSSSTAPSTTTSTAARDPPPEAATLAILEAYYARFPALIDWANRDGRTALHLAAISGAEGVVRLLCDLGADLDLADMLGNVPLHYASAWGHLPVVQLLIERGCQFAARNNEGFTASDFAYSFSLMTKLQESARLAFESSKRTHPTPSFSSSASSARTAPAPPAAQQPRQGGARTLSDSAAERPTLDLRYLRRREGSEGALGGGVHGQVQEEESLSPGVDEGAYYVPPLRKASAPLFLSTPSQTPPPTSPASSDVSSTVPAPSHSPTPPHPVFPPPLPSSVSSSPLRKAASNSALRSTAAAAPLRPFHLGRTSEDILAHSHSLSHSHSHPHTLALPRLPRRMTSEEAVSGSGGGRAVERPLPEAPPADHADVPPALPPKALGRFPVLGGWGSGRKDGRGRSGST